MGTTRRRSRNRLPDLDPGVWELLNDLPLPADANKFLDVSFDQEAEELWRVYGEQVLAEWVLEHPGSRPSCWWRYSAPDAFPGVICGEPTSMLKSGHYGRARIPPKDQRGYLAKHKLLRPGE